MKAACSLTYLQMLGQVGSTLHVMFKKAKQDSLARDIYRSIDAATDMTSGGRHMHDDDKEGAPTKYGC